MTGMALVWLTVVGVMSATPSARPAMFENGTTAPQCPVKAAALLPSDLGR